MEIALEDLKDPEDNEQKHDSLTHLISNILQSKIVYEGRLELVSAPGLATSSVLRLTNQGSKKNSEGNIKGRTYLFKKKMYHVRSGFLLVRYIQSVLRNQEAKCRR